MKNNENSFLFDIDKYKRCKNKYLKMVKDKSCENCRKINVNICDHPINWIPPRERKKIKNMYIKTGLILRKSGCL